MNTSCPYHIRTVPEGGVTEGQRFIVPFTIPIAKAVPAAGPASRLSEDIPIGVWRDDLCNCCAHGPCHPAFLNGWFCRSILIGQLLTRMKMTWLGQRFDTMERNNVNDSRVVVHEPWKNTFRILVVITVSFFVMMAVTSTPQTMDPTMVSTMDTKMTDDEQFEYITYNDLSNTDKVKYTLNGWISTLFSFYIIYILVKLRATMRQTYSIPEENCLCCYQLGICGNNPREGIQCCGYSVGQADGTIIGWEDLCCALWCSMCVTTQMARHTVDYREKPGKCCNDVGVYGWDDDEAYVGLDGGVSEGALLVV